VKSLFLLVANPTQMMNAIEARQFYSDSYSHFHLVVFSDSLAYQKQILSMADASWSKLIYPTLGTGKWNALMSIFSKKKFISGVLKMAIDGDALMIGNIHHYGCCSLAHRWNEMGNIFAMDDGLGTVNWDLQLNDSTSWTPRSAKGWRGVLERWILGVPVIKLSSLNFFSVYPLSHFTNATENKFDFLSESFFDKKYNENTVYFLEQPLVELGILPQSEYASAIQKIKYHYTNLGWEFTMVRHRAAHFQQSSDGIDYVSFDGPIEWVMKDWDKAPRKIATFYSSGVYHLNKMSQGNMIAEFWQIQNDKGNIVVQPQLMNWLSTNALSNMSVLNVTI
jgi:hypothetical protein